MKKDRMLAFSDGVIAIIITIMVLELKVPKSEQLSALVHIVPEFLSYVLSFLYVAVYWNNHHHLLHAAGRVTAAVLWANMHLLFWLSLIPFATGWMGENRFAPVPTAVYGLSLLMPAIAYNILQRTIVRAEGSRPALVQALGSDLKGKLSPVAYVVGSVLALYLPWLAGLVYAAVGLWWLVPDRRMERAVVGD